MSLDECSMVRLELSAYADGELRAAECAAVEAHLGACPKCAAEAQALRRLAGAVAALPRHEPGAGIGRRLRARLSAEAGARRETVRVAGDVKGWTFRAEAAGTLVLDPPRAPAERALQISWVRHEDGSTFCRVLQTW